MPDESKYLQYLPAIYAGGESGSFVGEFLGPFEAQFEGLRDLLSEIDHYFTPALAPTAPDFLSWLATWVALTLDASWDETKKRQVIAEAVKLYRYRGTVKGIERFLDIYTGRTPAIGDGAWPGGFQIEVASRLPVLEEAAPAPAAIRLVEIDDVRRREPLEYDDYYVVRAPVPEAPDASWPEGHPLRLYLQRVADEVRSGARPAGAGAETLRAYYLAAKVVAVATGVEGGQAWVAVRLANGQEHRYRPASVVRQDRLIDERYDLRQQGQAIAYRGDAYLVSEVELPYRFTLDIRVPCATWRSAFEALPLVFTEKPPQGGTSEELEQKRAAYEARLQAARAAWAARLGLVWEGLAAGNFPADLRDEFAKHGVTLPDKPVVTQGPLGTPGWRVTDTSERVWVIVRKGEALEIYAWIDCREWQQARKLDYVRSIRTIVDEAKPAHTAYYLRMAPDTAYGGGEQEFRPGQIGVAFQIGLDAAIG